MKYTVSQGNEAGGADMTVFGWGKTLAAAIAKIPTIDPEDAMEAAVELLLRCTSEQISNFGGSSIWAIAYAAQQREKGASNLALAHAYAKKLTKEAASTPHAGEYAGHNGIDESDLVNVAVPPESGDMLKCDDKPQPHEERRMKRDKTKRGLQMVTHFRKTLLEQSSTVGDYSDAPDKPGSSALYVSGGELDRQEVAEMVEFMQHWLKTGKLFPEEPASTDIATKPTSA